MTKEVFLYHSLDSALGNLDQYKSVRISSVESKIRGTIGYSFPSSPVYYSTKQSSNDCRHHIALRCCPAGRGLTLSGPSLVFAPASFVFVLQLEEKLFDRKA